MTPRKPAMHSQAFHEVSRSLNPLTRSRDWMVVSSLSRHCLPSSSWMKYLITEATMTPHRNTKPTSAPMRVVTSSSPEPTTDPETTIPGPMLRSRPPKPRGASLMSCDDSLSIIV